MLRIKRKSKLAMKHNLYSVVLMAVSLLFIVACSSPDPEATEQRYLASVEPTVTLYTFAEEGAVPHAEVVRATQITAYPNCIEQRDGVDYMKVVYRDVTCYVPTNMFVGT